MDFETYVINCVRSRPLEADWQQHLLHSAAAITAELTELLGFVQRWEGTPDSIGRHRLLRHVERVEFNRALLYYQLDLRPATRPSLDPFKVSVSSPYSSALGMAVQAGRVTSLVHQWILQKLWIDDQVKFTLERFEAHRTAFYDALAVDAERIWSSPGTPLQVSCHVAKPVVSSEAAAALVPMAVARYNANR